MGIRIFQNMKGDGDNVAGDSITVGGGAGKIQIGGMEIRDEEKTLRISGVPSHKAVFINGVQVKKDGVVDGTANAGVVIA